MERRKIKIFSDRYEEKQKIKHEKQRKYWYERYLKEELALCQKGNKKGEIK